MFRPALSLVVAFAIFTGPGDLIVISSAHLETATVFQAIAAAAVMGITLFHAVEALEKRVLFWLPKEAD